VNALFIIAFAVPMSVLLVALPLVRVARYALPTGSSPATWIHGREIAGSLTERAVEELIREELNGQRRNVSRR
jgi:hypothetical protein